MCEGASKQTPDLKILLRPPRFEIPGSATADRVNLCFLYVTGKDLLRGMKVVVQDRWTMDIGLGSPVVQHLTSDARAPGSIPSPAIYFNLYFFVYVHSSHPYYNTL